MLELSESTFRESLAGEKPTVVKFQAVWCRPCVNLAPIFEKTYEKFKDTINFATCDIDSCQEAAIEYNIEELPTLIIFEKGIPKVRKVGFLSEIVLEQWLKSNLT